MENKYIYKLSQKIAMMASLTSGLFLAVWVLVGFIIWKPGDLSLRVFLIGFGIFYIISFGFGIFITNKMKEEKMPSEKMEMELKSLLGASKNFIMPLWFVIVIKRFRDGLYEHTFDENTKYHSKESDKVKAGLQLLEKMKTDGFISEWKYQKEKPILEENYKKLLEIEKNLNKKEQE